MEFSHFTISNCIVKYSKSIRWQQRHYSKRICTSRLHGLRMSIIYALWNVCRWEVFKCGSWVPRSRKSVSVAGQCTFSHVYCRLQAKKQTCVIDHPTDSPYFFSVVANNVKRTAVRKHLGRVLASLQFFNKKKLTLVSNTKKKNYNIST